MRFFLALAIIQMFLVSAAIADEAAVTQVSTTLPSESPLKRGKWELDIVPIFAGWSSLGGVIIFVDNGVRYHFLDTVTLGIRNKVAFNQNGNFGQVGLAARVYWLKTENWNSYLEGTFGRKWEENKFKNNFARWSIGANYHITKTVFVGPELGTERGVIWGEGWEPQPTVSYRTANLGIIL